MDEYNLESNTQKLLSAGSSSLTVCDICKTDSIKTAKCFCKVCEEFLCKDCERAHRGSKATKDHKLIHFINMLQEKQRDIQREIKKLHDKRTEIQENVSSVASFTRQLHESKENLIAEVNKCRNYIKLKVDEHHDELIDEINITIENLQETLKETKTLFGKCDSKLEEKVSFLSGVANGQDYFLMIDTLANLSQQIEKDLQQIDRELPKFDSCMKCPINVLKGEEWNAQTATQIELTHPMMRELKCYRKVSFCPAPYE